MKRDAPVRRAARTVLLVGEGDAEVQLLQHLKRLYVQRGSGVSVQIKNARGKGAGHVVHFTIRQSLNAAYDAKAALLDTDTDWTEKTRTAARKARVLVLPCEPCLEAMMLTVHRVPVTGLTTAQLKQSFSRRFGATASEASVLRHFSFDLLNEARTRVTTLDELLKLIA